MSGHPITGGNAISIAAPVCRVGISLLSAITLAALMSGGCPPDSGPPIEADTYVAPDAGEPDTANFEPDSTAPAAPDCKHHHQCPDTGQPCLAATCYEGTCYALPLWELPCDDGDACTHGDRCSAGECVPDSAIACDDGDPCTDDSCDPGAGCVFSPNDAPCSDGNACTQGDVCKGGACVGSPVSCLDTGELCTSEVCEPQTGCVAVSCCGDLGAPCAAGFACTEHGTCEDDDEVMVPAGGFWKGCDPEVQTDELCHGWAEPQWWVDVPAFAIDRTEVTATDFALFLSDHGIDCGPYPCFDYTSDRAPYEPDGTGWSARSGAATTPADRVTWYGAREYCAWAGKRLCSESEWEKAALGGCEPHESTPETCPKTTAPYPWGAEPASCERAHMAETEGSLGCGTEALAPVGSYPAGRSRYGALDMAGNVSEWVEDCLYLFYDDGTPTDGTAMTLSCWLAERRVLRGGGMAAGPEELTGFYRGSTHKGQPFYPYDPLPVPFLEDLPGNFGVRCCRDLDP